MGRKLLSFCFFLLLNRVKVACLVSAHVNIEWMIFFLLYSANEDLGARGCVCCFVCVECLANVAVDR